MGSGGWKSSSAPHPVTWSQLAVPTVAASSVRSRAHGPGQSCHSLSASSWQPIFTWRALCPFVCPPISPQGSPSHRAAQSCALALFSSFPELPEHGAMRTPFYRSENKDREASHRPRPHSRQRRGVAMPPPGWHLCLPLATGLQPVLLLPGRS